MPRMLYINCSGPTSRSRTLSMRRLPRRTEKERGERTFVGHGRSDSAPCTHAGHGSEQSRKLRKGESMRDSSASRANSCPRISYCAKGSCVKRANHSDYCVEMERSNHRFDEKLCLRLRRLLARFREFFMTRLIIVFRQPTLRVEVLKYRHSWKKDRRKDGIR